MKKAKNENQFSQERKHASSLTRMPKLAAAFGDQSILITSKSIDACSNVYATQSRSTL